MNWANPEEFAMDFLFYQHSWVIGNAALDIWNPQYNQIGIACSCHNSFKQVCVVQIGQNVKSRIPQHYHFTSNSTSLNVPHIHPIERNHTLNIADYKFFLPGDLRCPNSKKDGMCGEVDPSTKQPA